MPWPHNDSDPLIRRKRELEAQQRMLVKRMSALAEDLQRGGQPVPDHLKQPEPPVWRMEDEGRPRLSDLTPARRRHLAHQRQRDMIIFFAFMVVLAVAVVLVYWLFKSRSGVSVS